MQEPLGLLLPTVVHLDGQRVAFHAPPASHQAPNASTISELSRNVYSPATSSGATSCAEARAGMANAMASNTTTGTAYAVAVVFLARWH